MGACIDRLLKDELNAGFVKKLDITENDVFWKVIKNCKNIFYKKRQSKNQYDLMEIQKVIYLNNNISSKETSKYIIMICDGENGNGRWSIYFENLANVMLELEKYFDAYLIKLDNDCLDDIHYAYIGLTYKDNQ